MTYGQVPRCSTALFVSHFLSLCPLAALIAASSLAASSLAARAAPTSELTVRLLAVGDGRLSVQESDGRVFPVKITSATWVLRHGLAAVPREFTPGETLRVRMGRGQDGAALLVCDAETAEALAAHRRHPLTGRVLSADKRIWVIQPDDSPLPLPVCLSPRTTYRAGIGTVTANAFGAGAAVTISTRGLANGLLMAVSVTDATEAGPETETPHRRSVFTGVVLEVRPDLGMLTLRDKAGTDQRVAVTAGTRVKVRKRAASLADIAAGMRVSVRLSAASDAAGNPAAASLTASDH